MSSDLKRVGVQVVADGVDVSEQSLKNLDIQVQETLTGLEALGKIFTEVLGAEGAASQLGVVSIAQRAQEGQDIWKKLLEERQTLSAQETVAQAQGATEYVDIWTKALKDRDLLEQQETVQEAQRINEYVQMWENANLKITQSRQTGQINNSTSSGRVLISDIDPQQLEEWKKIVEVGQAAGQTWSNTSQQIQAAGASIKEAQTVLGTFWQEAKTGATEATVAAETVKPAIEQIADSYRAAGAPVKELVAALKEQGYTTEQINQVLSEQEQQSLKVVKVNNDLQSTSIKVGLAFFALSIAARGVRDIGKELGQIYGEDVHRAFEKVADTMQTIGSFGSAGALIGSIFGPEGTLVGAGVGATIGVLSVLPQLLDQSSTATKDLVANFDKLSNQQDAVAELQQIGDVSADTAKKLTAAANAGDEYSQRFAKDLENLARAKQEQENAAPGAVQEFAARTFSTTAFGVDLTDEIIAKRKAQAQADTDAAKSSIELDVQVLKVQQDYAGWIGMLEKLKDSDTAAIIRDQTGATKEQTDAVQEVLKVHPEWAGDILQTSKNIEELNTGLKDAPQYTNEYTAALTGQQKVLADQIKLLSDLNDVEKQHSALSQTLSKDGGLTDTQELQSEAGVTKDVSDRFLEFAKSHEEVAKQAAALDDDLKAAQESMVRLRDAGITSGAEFDALTRRIETDKAALHELTTANQDYTDVLKEVEAAQKKVNAAIAEAAYKQGELSTKTQQQHDAAQQQYQDAIDNASRTEGQAEATALQTRQDKLSDLWTQYTDKVLDINTNLDQKLGDIAQAEADKEFDIQQQLSDKIDQIQQSLADKLQQIQQGLQNKLDALAHSRDQAIESDNAKILKAAQDLAEKLYQIERTRVQATEDLAYSTKSQLDSAGTEHDRDKILRDAQEKQAIIDRTANNQRHDAEQTFKDAVEAAKKEKELAQENYDYEVSLAKKLAAQQEAEARQSAAEQIALAKHTADEQIAQAQRQAKEQTATAEREAAQAKMIAERQWNEQTAAAKRSYDEQVKAAQQAEKNKTDDAKRALDERNAAIDQSAENERRQIQHTLDDALAAYRAEIASVQNLSGLIAAMMTMELEAAGMYKQLAEEAAKITANLFKGWTDGMQNLIGGKAFDGSTSHSAQSGPPPSISQSILGGTSGGSRQVSTPGNTSNSTRNIVVNMPIYDATDPNRVGKIVRQQFAGITSGAG